MSLVILVITACITYSFEIIFGLAGTILMLPIMTFFYPAKTLVLYSILPQTLLAIVGLINSPQRINAHFLAKMLGFAFFGGLAGIYIFSFLSAPLFQLLLALMITFSGIYLVASPQNIKISPLLSRIFDFFSGLSHSLFGISGPIVMTRLLGTFEDKTTVRNYALGFFLCINMIRLSGYVTNKSFTPQVLEMMAVSTPFLLLTFFFANKLHFKINSFWFRKVVAVGIVLGGVFLFFKS